MKQLLTPIAELPDSSIAGHFMYFQQHLPYLHIWRKIKTDPIVPASVEALARRGWRVECDPDLPVLGYTRYVEQKIGLRYSRPSYERDSTLCHEFVHAYYNSRRLYIGGGRRWADVTIKEIIAEHLGRELCKDAKFLPEILHAFGLEPGVYDFYSARIFGKEIPDR